MNKKVAIGMIALILVIGVGVAIYFANGQNETTTGSTNENNAKNIAQEESETEIDAESVEDEVEEGEDTTVSDSKILVTYFSWGGTTEKLAQEIADKTGADIARIDPVTPYTTNYNECTEVALEEQRNNARPEYKKLNYNLADYDIIFVGYPIWWMDLPMVMYTFFENEDFSGKTVVPFITSYSSGEDGTTKTIKNMIDAKEIKEYLHIYNRDMDGYMETTDAWLNGLGY